MISRVLSSVLVVDDDSAFLALVVRMLEQFGVETVLTAVDAASALSEAEAKRPDAALVDIGLPDRDGRDLARQLAELPWKPRVIVTSVDGDASRTIGAPLDDAGVAFVAKEELVSETLHRLLLRD